MKNLNNKSQWSVKICLNFNEKMKIYWSWLESNPKYFKHYASRGTKTSLLTLKITSLYVSNYK